MPPSGAKGDLINYTCRPFADRLRVSICSSMGNGLMIMMVSISFSPIAERSECTDPVSGSFGGMARGFAGQATSGFIDPRAGRVRDHELRPGAGLQGVHVRQSRSQVFLSSLSLHCGSCDGRVLCVSGNPLRPAAHL